MEQRTRDILNLLLQENIFQTTNELAKKLNVSSKTISRQIPKVEEVLNSAGLKLEKKSGFGILITCWLRKLNRKKNANTLSTNAAQS